MFQSRRQFLTRLAASGGFSLNAIQARSETALPIQPKRRASGRGDLVFDKHRSRRILYNNDADDPSATGSIQVKKSPTKSHFWTSAPPRPSTPPWTPMCGVWKTGRIRPGEAEREFGLFLALPGKQLT